MEFIKEWVTTIVIFVLIATIVDMIIPNSNMHKYVKMVIGLLLITVIISPIFSLLSKNYTLDFSSFGVIPTASYVKQEILIDSQKKEIERVQAAYILEETAIQLSKQVEEELMETYELTIDEIELVVNSYQAKDLLDNLDQIKVVVSNSSLTTNIKEIKNIEMVQVNISRATPVKVEEDYKDVIRFLAKSWNVKEQQIIIYQKGEV